MGIGQWELKVRKEGPCVMFYVHFALSGLHPDVKILYTRGQSVLQIVCRSALC